MIREKRAMRSRWAPVSMSRSSVRSRATWIVPMMDRMATSSLATPAVISCAYSVSSRCRSA